jgi:hypothetical protein
MAVITVKIECAEIVRRFLTYSMHEEEQEEEFDLVCRGIIYTVPKSCVAGLLRGGRDANGLKSLVIQSETRTPVFEAFLYALMNGLQFEVTEANVAEMRRLASEFRVPALLDQCTLLSVSDPEEEDGDDFSVRLPADIGLRLLVPEREHQACRTEFDRLVEATGGADWTWSVETVQCPLTPPEDHNGFIAYLARTHRGNLHEIAIVTVVSSSVAVPGPACSPENILSFDPTTSFRSENAVYEWVCWTFHLRQVVVQQYTIVADGLRSWWLEGSRDARRWYRVAQKFVLDRRSNREEFKAGLAASSFTVTRQADCRYIRLVQTGPNHWGRDCYCLSLTAVEFFGTLTEPRYF